MHILFCYSDMTIGITDMGKSTTEVLTGHRAPVLGVSLDPKLEYLVSFLTKLGLICTVYK